MQRTGKRIIKREELPTVQAAIAPTKKPIKKPVYGKENGKGKPMGKPSGKPTGKFTGKSTGKPTNGAPKRKLPPRKPQQKPLISPSERKAKEFNDRLNGFKVWLTYQPLALGIETDLFRLASDECFPGASKRVIEKVLWAHTHHGRYLQNILKGGMRVWLDGEPDDVVSFVEKEYAAEQIRKRADSK